MAVPMSNGSTPAPCSPSSTNLSLLIARIACSLPVLYHGSQILFGAFSGSGPRGFAAYEHLPVVFGYLVGLAQFAGGLAILLGVLLRVGAVCVAIVMVGAIYLVHWTHGFDIGKGGMEFALTVLLLSLALLLTGPGAYSFRGLLPGRIKNL